MRVSAEEIRKLDGKVVTVGPSYDPELPEWNVEGRFYVDVPTDEELTGEGFVTVSDNGGSSVTFKAKHIREIDRANVLPHVEIER